MLTAALVSVGLAACQWLRIEPPIIGLMPVPPGHRPFGNLAQPNHLATLLVIGSDQGRLASSSAAALGEPSWAQSAVFLCIGIALTQSRQVWIGLVVLSIWVAFARRRAGVRVSGLGGTRIRCLLAVLIAFARAR